MPNTTPDSTLYNQTQELVNRLQIALRQPNNPPPYKPFAKTLMDQPPSIITPTPSEISVEDIDLPEPSNHVLHDNSHDKSNYLPSNETSPIGFELWEALAYDLALAHADPVTITNEYNITIAQLEHLQNNEYFSKMLKSKQEEVAQLGSQASEVAFTVKMRMLANRATPEFLKRLTHPATSTKDFHNLYKLAVELAQLNPTDRDEADTTPVIGASVVFNISGVPGLSHLQATQATEITMDAEYTEILPTKEKDDDGDELREL